ncbi:7,8-didemethyl-8-hydroxy-5-deazariboflavin synthase subunit CofG [Geminocystis sp. GBBB08]|uniref:7,8-didemethyl-8-hydroxy-5-deazariboflavin synthase subunit CofG n=1 Tax=Geminocystis sp. GBBB08 TaxID=2604140 RepID=UPI0027E2DE0A|nr:7,8-didemethyl-8-hydroxy-5-deazariboflavin synthase subunit CofG [Geminocystis sp. GBBB08]MBL1210016.1 7,8-didemethyl-8-hydroxy-5-deazariboflavin synthase subunit CofG [Geminocystis sp. GBBB08]
MSKIITYSPAFTIVPTYECFNRCTYCNFRTDPHQSSWLELDEAKNVLANLEGKGITEILILSGEIHPKSTRRKPWIQRIYDLGKLALSMGFFPHANAGVLSFEEMSLLKEVNVSMGLMLEQLTPNLLNTVHRHAPTKIPEIRLQQLEWAGMLKIPFTTGILLGIGETLEDRMESLRAIAKIQGKWGHIQEVILQPYVKGSKEKLQEESLSQGEILEIIAIARDILPETITLQIPPNLIDSEETLLKCLELGVRDLGGIVPKDEVNPDYHHQNLEILTKILQKAGWKLKPRLPVYPQYYSW